MLRHESFIGSRLGVVLVATVSFGCGTGSDASNARVVAPGMTSAAAGAAAAAAVASGFDSPNDPVQPPAATIVEPSAPAGCAPGVYSGDYDIGLLGSGPIMFTLVASQPASSSSVPCQEFCPELVVSSDGGEFKASLIDTFEGSAKLQGGLDCRTGEFRVEMVDGQYSFGAPNDPNALQLGELTGEFTGHFSAGAPAAIKGDIKCNAGIDVEGTFSVQRSP